METQKKPDYFRILIILVVTLLIAYGLIYMVFYSEMLTLWY